MSNTDLHIIGELAFQQLLLGHIVLLGPLLSLLEESVEVLQGTHKERNALEISAKSSSKHGEAFTYSAHTMSEPC